MYRGCAWLFRLEHRTVTRITVTKVSISACRERLALAGKTRRDRLYTRVQGSTGTVRYYADLRDLGGGQLALRAPGSGRATTDPDQARILLGKVLEDIKTGKMPSKTTRPKKRRGDETRLGPMAQRLITDNPGDVTEKWQADVERRLQRAQDWFGKERSLISIEPVHLRAWIKSSMPQASPMARSATISMRCRACIGMRRSLELYRHHAIRSQGSIGSHLHGGVAKRARRLNILRSRMRLRFWRQLRS